MILLAELCIDFRASNFICHFSIDLFTRPPQISRAQTVQQSLKNETIFFRHNAVPLYGFLQLFVRSRRFGFLNHNDIIQFTKI